MADFIQKPLGQLNHEVDEKGKQLNDLRRKLSRCTDAAQQGVFQSELSQLESTIDDLIALRKLLIPLALAGAGAGAPPAAPRRLVDSAAKLQLLPQRSDDDGVVWKLTHGHSARTYVDAAGTGKSYTLEHVVPAVVAAVLRKQQQQQQAKQQQQQAKQQQAEHGLLAGMVVLRLKGDQLDRTSGAAIMLQSLLIVLLGWAREEHVPLRAGALAAAEAALALPDMGMPSIPGRAIFAFLKAVEVPVLVLCDEMQRLFLPLIGGAEPDAAGAAYMRDVFMKQLLLDGPHTMLWCLTGSSMAHTCISIARMPPNGYPLITMACAIHLPATYSAAHVSFAWQQLQQNSGPDVELDRQLLELCPQSIPLLTFLVHTWLYNRGRSDVHTFVRDFMRFKLMEQARREWTPGLEAVPASQRLTILDLSFPAVGARIDTGLHPGLKYYLTPHLEKRADGHYFLRDSHQRQIVRFLINEEGALRSGLGELAFSATLTQLDGGWNLFHLGEAADYLLGPGACRRLSRNVLGRTKPWDRETGSKLLDVGVVEALPGVLGQSLFAFNEAMVGALRLLPRPTVQAAAAAFAAELSGGVCGGSVDEGSGEDDSSSGGGLSSGSGGAGSTSGGGGRGRGAGAMPIQCAPSRPAGPAAAAGCGQRPPLVYATGGTAAAAAAAMGPRLPRW
eukprot:XP_001697297.1 predicted protein [Chlamydomonas reinhardtii]